jgi:tryptophan synthase
MDGLKAAFARAKAENRSALVGYWTHGYPTIEETPDIMLGMQRGGVGQCLLTGFYNIC